MELQIQDLVSSIKKDGIDSANKEAAVILTAGERLPFGRGWRIHYVRLPEPLPADPVEQASLINQTMETLIRRFPTQYLWSYNRYKTPRGAPPAPAADTPASAS